MICSRICGQEKCVNINVREKHMSSAQFIDENKRKSKICEFIEIC